ncbi:MAG TPA: DUF2993 domain-containing protein [Mycobacteriales bacterium]|nr:DUF2993 domain-containing protein [Mycobacteriales bacterium]HWC34223.1 DUF2993 domain-containing protein [Mycobacteriales bacterium]
MLRRLLIAVLVLILAAVVVVDRVGEHVAAHVLAGKLQTDEHLAKRPSVSIGGIPFLTQAFGGDYHDVSVTAHGVKTQDGVTISTLKAHLHDAHIPFSKVLGGSVAKVPIDRVDGSAFVSFGDISHYLSGQGLSVTLSRAAPGGITLIGQVPLAGRTRLVHAVVHVAVSHSVVTLAGSSHAGALALPIPLRALPFRFAITSVTVGADGITGTGTANHVTLGS